MPQAHGDRLTAIDASFLAQERANSHMHVGAVMLFEGPPPSYRDCVNHIRGRLHLVPRYRQKLAVPPLETGRPVWVDDASGVDLATVLFDLSPVPQPAPHEGEPWVPQPEPTTGQLVARGLAGLVRAPLELAGRARAAPTRPQATLDAAHEAGRGIAQA